jgi:maltooligosyltrehalose synthase
MYMQRFFFHVVSGTSRYQDETGTLLGSLQDVVPHGQAIAKVLTKHWPANIKVGQHSSSDDYLEVEDQESKFLIMLPLSRLMNDAPQAIRQISDPIDLREYRLARRYAGALHA